MTITLGNCPHCAAVVSMAMDFIKEHEPDGPWVYLHRAECACGYCGPYDIDKTAAARHHNKISQNCGAS